MTRNWTHYSDTHYPYTTVFSPVTVKKNKNSSESENLGHKLTTHFEEYSMHIFGMFVWQQLSIDVAFQWMLQVLGDSHREADGRIVNFGVIFFVHSLVAKLPVDVIGSSLGKARFRQDAGGSEFFANF